METDVFQDVKNPFKKAFKRHQDKLYKTVQSKPVEIGSETYVFVGQMRLQSFPLVSHFDVFDHNGQSANEDAGRDVYTFVSLLMLSRYVREMKETLDQSSKQAVTNEQVSHFFKGMDEKDAKRLSSFPVQAVEQLAFFLRSVDEVTAKERWDASDMKQIKTLWEAFGQQYNDRADALLQLRANYRPPQTEETADSRSIQLLWKEASLFTKLSESLMPMNATYDQFSLNDLVVYHYDFGRLRRQDEQLEMVAKLERGLYQFIVILMRVFFVLSLLIVVVLMADGEFEFVVVFPLVSFLIIGSFVKAQNKRRLIAKNNTYVAELRAVSVVEEEPMEDGQTDEVQWTREHPLYEAVVVSMDLVKVFAVLTAVFIIVTIALLVEGDVDYVAMQYVFYVDVALFLLTVYLPFSRVAKRKVTVTKQAIHIRKEKVSALEAIRIVVKNKGSDVDVFVNYNNNPFKLRVNKNDRAPLKRALKTWCAQNRIAFQDKDVTDA